MTANRTRLIIAIALIALASFFWGGESELGRPNQANTDVPDNIDFFLRDANITQYTVAGKPEQQLLSPYVRHFPKQDAIHADDARMTVFREQQSPMKVEAALAIAKDDNSLVNLINDVVIYDTPASGAVTTLKTEKLDVYPDQQYADTDVDVEIKQGQDTTHSVGMQAYLDENRVELNSRVRGLYHVE